MLKKTKMHYSKTDFKVHEHFESHLSHKYMWIETQL